MSKFTRIISLILAAVLVFAAVPVSASVEHSGPRSNVTYSFDEETGVLTFSGTGEIGDYFMEDFDVWLNCTSIVIEEGITCLGNWSLERVSGFESVSIPSTMTFFSPEFITCVSSFTTITVAEGNPTYCSVDGALYSADMTELVRVPTGRRGVFQIPTSCTKIGASAFGYCLDITGVVIPDSVTYIEGIAFQHSGLTELTIPSSVTVIGDGAFLINDQLESITLPEGLESLSSRCFFWCDRLETITIPAGITSIGGSTFWSCESLREVTVLGDITVTSNGYAIGDSAFEDCLALEKMTFRCPCPDTETISPNAFEGCPDGIEVHYPRNCPEWAEVKPFDSENRHFVYIPDEPIPLVTGDANGDGVLSASDVSVVLSFVMNAGTMTKMAQLAADVDGDGKVTAADASLMAQLILG